MVYAGTGHVIASRVPRNAIGWVLCLVGLSLAATMMTEQYALRGLVAAPGSLPVARLAGWLSEVMFVLTFAPMFFLVLLFPDGRLPSRRWRPVLWALFAVTAGWEAQRLQAGTTIVGGFTNGVGRPPAAVAPVGRSQRQEWFLVLFGWRARVSAAPAMARSRQAGASPDNPATIFAGRRGTCRRRGSLTGRHACRPGVRSLRARPASSRQVAWCGDGGSHGSRPDTDRTSTQRAYVADIRPYGRLNQSIASCPESAIGVSRSDRSIPARSLTVAMAGRSWDRDNGFAKTHAYGGDAGARKGTPLRYSRSMARNAHGE